MNQGKETIMRKNTKEEIDNIQEKVKGTNEGFK